MRKYDTICDEFLKNCENKSDQVKSYMYAAVNNIKRISDDDEYIFDFFCDILENLSVIEITLDEFKYMLELGVNLSYDPKRIFIAVSSYQKPDIALYLLDNNYITMGEIIEDKITISQCLHGNIDVVKIILQQGVSQKNYNEVMKYFLLDIPRLKLFIDHGADLGSLMDLLVSPGNVLLSHLQEYMITIKFILKRLKSEKMCSNYDSKLMTDFLKVYLETFQDLVDLETIKIIIDKGADPKDPMIFAYACQYVKNSEIILCLVNEYGCDINIEHSRALCYAIVTDNYDIFVLLLQLGIEVTNKSLSQIYANFSPNHNYTEALIRYGTSPERISEKILKHNKSTLKYLSENGVDFNELIRNF